MSDTGIPSVRTIVVVGNSMYPTLRALDVVTISTNNTRKICPGDIIVFPSPKNNQKVIHRVVSIAQQGIVTRGDNSILTDGWMINPVDVLGKVEFARRGNRQLHIYNGMVGQLIASILFVFYIFFYYTKGLLYRINKILFRSGIIDKFFPKIIRPKVLSFKRSDGLELQLLMGRMVIGQYIPSSERWEIKNPYKLFVDKEYLENVRKSSITLPNEANRNDKI